MPELKEVFEMVSQKVEPDLDEWNKQEQRQRRSAGNRRLGTFALVAALLMVGAIVVLGTVKADRDEATDVGGNPTVASGALDFRDYGKSVVAHGRDLGYGWYLSDPNADPLGVEEGVCLAIGGESVCYHFNDENALFVDCLARKGGYLLAVTGTDVDRLWVNMAGSATIEGGWMPFRSPEVEGRVWIAFLPGTGQGILRIGGSHEQPVSWAPCGD